MEGRFVVREIQELNADDELRRCVISDGDTDQTLPESILLPVPPSIDDPASFFESLQWDQPHHFFARLNLSLTRTQWYSVSEGLPTLRGARVRPLAHQLYAARRVLEAHSPRFVLADEVGLGKTIETGLVIQALLAADPDLRVLVVAPGSMSRQWLCELYLRFGGRAFVHVPGDVVGGPPVAERRRRLAAPRLIVSTTALLVDEPFRNALVDLPWDLVVIDEAHQISPQHSLYPTLRELSARSTGFLALSATPSKREACGLTGLLALVAPDAYALDDGDALAAKLKDRRDIWRALTSTEDILGAARNSEDGAPDQETIEFLVDDWNGVLPEEPEVARMLSRARDGEVEALDELVAYVQEHYRIDHRIVRTRRRTLGVLGTRFARRQLKYLEYEPSAPEILLAQHMDKLATPEAQTAAQTLLRILFWRGLCATAKTFIELIEGRVSALEQDEHHDTDACAHALTSDPGPGEQEQLEHLLVMHTPALPEERAWLEAARGLAREWLAAGSDACARHRDVMKWLGELLTTSPNAKVLVFAQDRSTVCEFVEVLRAHHPQWGAEAFHHALDDRELEEAAHRFQRLSRHRILVSDELGGEGRNFQMAACVVHLDTPLSVGRVEQRIGRLDRMGREPDCPVTSIVVRGPSRVERALQDMHESAFRVFTDSVGGLEFVLPRLQNMMYAAIGKGEDLAEITRQMKSEVDSTLAEVDEDFELSLDSSRKQLEQARELAEIFEESADDGEERKVRHWLGTLGVDPGRDRRKIRFKWTAETLSEPLLGFDAGDGSTPFGTFDRSAALADESLHYFAPGHKLVDAALAALSSSRHGRATMLRRELGSLHQNQMFIVLLGTSRLDESDWEGEGIPTGLQTKAHRFLWPSSEITCVRISVDVDEEPEMVRDHELRQRLIRIYERDTGDREFTVDELLEAVSSPGPLWTAVRGAVSTGLDELNRNLESLRDEAAQELAEMMSMEMGYLRNQIRLGLLDARDAHHGLQQRERLLQSVRRARIELESIALVLGR
ncbi:helicase-related protein [Enhygromyxa salina]|nr:helicase-related protein [Enhygromyxa salina]